MLAGFAEIDFTPESGNSPGGFFPNLLTGNDGGCFSNVMALTSGSESVILISMDILSFHKEYGDDMRRRISEATGVAEKNILIAAIHTHSSTSCEYQLWMCPPDLEITAKVADLTVEAAVRAWNQREEAALGVGVTYNAKYNFCRDFLMKDGTVRFNPGYDRDDIVRPTGSPDHSVNVMRVDGADGKVKGFVVNYANHPCCPERRPELRKSFSADFPGYLRRALKREYGEDVKVLFFTGPAGDVNCMDYQFGTTKYYSDPGVSARKIIGEGLAEDIKELNPRIFAKVNDPVIQSASELCYPTRRKKTAQHVEWAKKILEKAKTENVDQGAFAFATEYTTEEDAHLPDTVDFEVHTMQIGPWAIVGLPGEIFSEIGKKIKAESPFPCTLVFELANGTNGYISPDHVQRSETYEARYSQYNAYTGIGTADLVIKKSVDMLTKLYEKDNEIRFVNK